MGFFSDLSKAVLSGVAEGVRDGVRGARGAADGLTCPECRSELTLDDFLTGGGEERFECSNDACNNPVWFRRHGGPLVDPSQRDRTSGRSRSCIGCQQELQGEITDAWEDGDNDLAYVTCRRCGAENYV